MRKFWFVILALSFICAHARGDTTPDTIGVPRNHCIKFLLCDAETDTGVCKSGGDELVLEVLDKWTRFTFYSNQSVDSPYSCHIYSNNMGHDAESGDGIQVTSTPLTEDDEAITLSNVDFGCIWVNCSEITTNVTITVNACSTGH